jgi:hypothetical protein
MDTVLGEGGLDNLSDASLRCKDIRGPGRGGGTATVWEDAAVLLEGSNLPTVYYAAWEDVYVLLKRGDFPTGYHQFYRYMCWASDYSDGLRSIRQDMIRALADRGKPLRWLGTEFLRRWSDVFDPRCPRATEQQIDAHAGSNNPLHAETVCLRVFPFPYDYFAARLDSEADLLGIGGWDSMRRERHDHAKGQSGVKTLAYGFDMSRCKSQKDQTWIIKDGDPGESFWAALFAFDEVGDDSDEIGLLTGLETIRMFHVDAKTFQA